MVRYALLYALVVGLMALAVYRWFWALCGLVFLTVLTQHPDMPTNVLGLQGLNPWNVTLLVITGAWVIQRRSDPPSDPAPLGVLVALGAYIAMVVVAGVAAAVDGVSLRAMFGGKSIAQWLLVDGMINPLKYLLIGVMFYDGARTRPRVQMGLFSAVGSAMAYAFLMFKSMGPRVFTIDFEDARRMTDKLIGLFANDIGELLAFTFWAALALAYLLRRRSLQVAWVTAIALILPPFIALKSRAGFGAFVIVGAVLGVLRWRKALVALPVAILVVFAVTPSVQKRVLSGFDDRGYNWDTISAGRLTNIWPPVIEQIGKSPIIGHGRYAILREDCATEIIYREGTLPGHPHNEYLEILLDAGVVGLAICLTLVVLLFRAAFDLLRHRRDPLVLALGTVALTALLAELSAGLAGSSFYPTQSMVPYLCAWGMSLRVHHQLAARPVPRLRRAAPPPMASRQVAPT